jgi:phospholipid transport system substrate-binding protein
MKGTWKRVTERGCAALLLTFLVGTAPATAQSPSQVVDGLANQVVSVLKNGALDSQQKRAAIENIAYGAIDFTTLCKLVLARNWPKFSPAQRTEFEQEFKQHLSMTYGRNVDSYKNEKVQILGERPESRDDVTVQTKILRGGGSDDVVVDYRLRQSSGQWKIIDVIIEGVSMVSNFRSQFQDIVTNGGPDRLLSLLREKNAAGETLAKP